MAKYLFMYVSGGAGHVGRSITIANYLKDMDKGAEIIFAGGRVGKGIVEENGFMFIELETPEYFEDNRPTSDIGKLFRIYVKNLGEYRRTMLSVNPDVVVVDTEPLFAFLSRFLGFRTVFISHELQPLWVEDISPFSKKLRDFILRCTNRVSDAIIFPNIMGMDIDDKISRKTKSVGPLAYMNFEKFRLEGEKKVLIVPSFTGSAPPELLEMLKKRDFAVYIRAKGNSYKNIRFLKKTRNLLSYIDAVDVLICSGYSTIMEGAALGKPMIIYPKTEEQRIVGRMCEENGIALYAESPDEVMDALNRIFSDKRLAENMLKRQKSYENGAMEAAKFLKSMAKPVK